MNKLDESEKDLLRKYLSPENIEMAPKDFTENVMRLIRVEKEQLQPAEKQRSKYFVPVLAVLITLILIISAYFTPLESNEPMIINGMKFLEYINNQAIEFRIDFLSEINFPGWLVYFFIGILFFALFDKVLHGVFQKEK